MENGLKLVVAGWQRRKWLKLKAELETPRRFQIGFQLAPASLVLSYESYSSSDNIPLRYGGWVEFSSLYPCFPPFMTSCS